MTVRPELRIPPLPADEWDGAVRSALAVMLPPERINPADAGNILSTLVRNPELAKTYLQFNAYLLSGSTLPIRLREFALLRIVHHHDCAYLWDHHVPIAHRAGLTNEEIEAIRCGNAKDHLDRLVLSAVDELDRHSTITGPTWDELGGQLDDHQRMDLVFVIGAYALLATVVNTFGIQYEHVDSGQRHG